MVIKMIAISTFQYIILYIIGNNDSRKVLDFLIRNASKKKLTDFFFLFTGNGSIFNIKHVKTIFKYFICCIEINKV